MQVSPFSDREAVLLQMHQLQSDMDASSSQAAEKEETARREIDELKLQVQECLFTREHEKNVSRVVKLICSVFSGNRRMCSRPQLCGAGGTCWELFTPTTCS